MFSKFYGLLLNAGQCMHRFYQFFVECFYGVWDFPLAFISDFNIVGEASQLEEGYLFQQAGIMKCGAFHAFYVGVIFVYQFLNSGFAAADQVYADAGGNGQGR